MSLARLTVEGVVLHELPKKLTRQQIRDEAQSNVRLSGAETPLDDPLRHYIERQLYQSLDKAALDVEFDPEASSIAPKLVTGFLDDPTVGIISLSRDLAEALYESQTPVSNEGVLAVVRGHVGGQTFLAVLKLEHEKGLSFEEKETDAGEIVLHLTLEDDLVMTQGTKVFKAGIFSYLYPPNADGRAATEPVLDAKVSDMQRRATDRRPIAQFFVGGFLGCRYVGSPEMTTGAFFNGMEDVLNKTITDVEARADIHEALVVEMRNNQQRVDPRRFIKNHVPEADQDLVATGLVDLGVNLQPFAKDLSLTESWLRKTIYRFDNGAYVRVPASDEGTVEGVEVRITESGDTRVTVEGELRDIHG